MVKDNETVIEYVVFNPDHDAALTQNREFNEQVNMTAGELEEWLRRTVGKLGLGQGRRIWRDHWS